MPPSESTRIRSALQGYCAQWRTLTAAEGDAIRDGHWPQVQQLQESKRQLQEFIIAAIRELSPAERDQIQAEFRPLVEELICLEGRNREQLAAQRQRLELQRQQLETSGLNLRQLRAAYSTPPAPVWHSYS
jgi:hypothetical protein